MAEAWKELRVQQIDVEFTSSWPDVADQEIHGTATPKVYEEAWVRNVLDVRQCDAVLVYGGAEDILCGALVEAGVALGLGKTVICVGSSRSFGTWQYHPNVFIAKTVIEAINLAKKLFK